MNIKKKASIKSENDVMEILKIYLDFSLFLTARELL